VLQGIRDRLVFGGREGAPPAEVPVPAKEGGGREGAPPAEVPVPASEASPRPVLDVTRHFEFGVGIAPFLAMGDASEFFTVGVAPSLSWGYRWRTPAGHVRVSLLASACAFSAEGPGVSYHGGTSPGLFVSITGGGALLAVDPNESGYLTKLLPFFSGGVGGELLPSDTLGAFFELSYQVYLEREQPIMGYAPQVGMFYRF
jgi:hypothetical protein